MEQRLGFKIEKEQAGHETDSSDEAEMALNLSRQKLQKEKRLHED